MSQDFPKPFKKFGENFSVNVDLSNYATKTHLKDITYVDTSKNKFTYNNSQNILDEL